MLEEEIVGDVNNDLNSELNKLVVSMSALNIVDHKATIAVCYAKYFQQRVREFGEIEQQIRLLVKSFKSKTSEFKIAKIPGDINKFSDKYVSITGENYNSIETEGFSGFGSEQCYTSLNNTIAQSTTNARKSTNESDSQKLNKETEMNSWNDLCDFFLEDDDSGDYPALRVTSPNMVDVEESTAATSAATTSAESATIVHIDKTGAVGSSSPIVTGNSSHMVEASKPAIKTTTSGVAKQNWVVVENLSNMSKSPKLVLRATTSGVITQSGAAAGHSTNMVEAARPAIKILIKQSPILNGHPFHVVEASKPVIKASTSGVIKQNLVAAVHSSNMADASESLVKATTSGITTQSPKIDKFNIVKSPDVPQSVAVAQPPAIDGSNIASTSQNGVTPIKLDQEDMENICRNIPEEYHMFPARQRLKRYLAEMTARRNLPGVVQHMNADETDETPTKRRRE